MLHRPSIGLLLLIPALLPALAGCPGSLDNPERFKDGGGADCSDVPALLAMKCGTSGCHASSNPANGLDLASDDPMGRLSGKAATGGMGTIIDPSAPEDSVLYQKLTDSPPFGGRMPPGAPFDETTMACILSWIEAGK